MTRTPPAMHDEPAVPRAGRRMDSDERREQLLTIGLELFAGRTYDEVSVDDIGAATGASRSLLYHYFGNKRGFYVEVLRTTAAALIEVLQPEEGLTPLENLLVSTQRALAWIREHEVAYMTVMQGGIGTDPEVAAVVDEVRSAIGELVLASVDIPEELRPLALAHVRGYVGYMEGLVPWLLAGRISDEQLLGLASAAVFSWFEATDGITIAPLAR